MMFCGVLSSMSSGLTPSRLIPVTTAAINRASSADILTDLRSSSQFSAPNRWEMMMENPWVKPVTVPCTSQLIHSQTPRAANASTPTTCPTMMVSTMVYICWKTFPSISGRAKKKMSPAGLPEVISRTRAAIVKPPLHMV